MPPPTQVTRWEPAVRATLTRLTLNHSLNGYLVLAIIWKESGGNPWAWNPEPKYRWLMNVNTWKPFRPMSPAEIASEVPPADFPCLAGDRDQEWWGQQASWSLMQIMGSAAREQGFKGPYLPELCDPYINLEFGIKHLWNYAMQYGNRTVHDGLQRWNGGGDPLYADSVLSKETEIAKVF